VFAWPALHWAMQAMAPAEALPTLAGLFDTLDETPAQDEAPAIADGNLVAGLYAAARGGRVDRALALLDAGADPHALPPVADRDQRSLPVLAAVLPDLRLLRA
jgi:hypothetical protein